MRQGTTWTGQKVKYKGHKIEPCGIPLLFDSYLIWMELVRSIGNSDILLTNYNWDNNKKTDKCSQKYFDDFI